MSEDIDLLQQSMFPGPMDIMMRGSNTFANPTLSFDIAGQMGLTGPAEIFTPLPDDGMSLAMDEESLDSYEESSEPEIELSNFVELSGDSSVDGDDDDEAADPSLFSPTSPNFHNAHPASTPIRRRSSATATEDDHAIHLNRWDRTGINAFRGNQHRVAHLTKHAHEHAKTKVRHGRSANEVISPMRKRKINNAYRKNSSLSSHKKSASIPGMQ